MKRLGDILRKWRTMSNLTLEQVARDMGTTTTALSRFERGGHPDGRTLCLILKWLLD